MRYALLLSLLLLAACAPRPSGPATSMSAADAQAGRRYLEGCATALEIARDPIARRLPPVTSCSDAPLGLVAPAGVQGSRIAIDEAADSFNLTLSLTDGRELTLTDLSADTQNRLALRRIERALKADLSALAYLRDCTEALELSRDPATLLLPEGEDCLSLLRPPYSVQEVNIVRHGYTFELEVTAITGQVFRTRDLPDLANRVSLANVSRERAFDNAAQVYIRECVTAMEVNRDPVSQRLPAASQCEGEPLGLNLRAGVLESRVMVLPERDVYTVEAVSATGNRYLYDGSQIRQIP